MICPVLAIHPDEKAVPITLNTLLGSFDVHMAQGSVISKPTSADLYQEWLLDQDSDDESVKDRWQALTLKWHEDPLLNAEQLNERARHEMVCHWYQSSFDPTSFYAFLSRFEAQPCHRSWIDSWAVDVIQARCTAGSSSWWVRSSSHPESVEVEPLGSVVHSLQEHPLIYVSPNTHECSGFRPGCRWRWLPRVHEAKHGGCWEKVVEKFLVGDPQVHKRSGWSWFWSPGSS